MAMKIFLRILGFAAAAGIALAVLGLAWLTSRFQGGGPKISGEMHVAGLEGKVRIIRDDHGVPHIFGAHDSEIYFGLGFAHAQDRIFQMDLTRRLMQGRLSELVGPRALDLDAKNRILGWSRTANAQWAAMGAPTKAILTAYTAGVNAAIASGASSPEYAILLTRPKPWHPLDSLAAALAMTDQLTGGDEMERARYALSPRLSPAQIAEFLTGYPDWAPRTYRAGELPFEREGASLAPGGGEVVENQRPGSNTWVVSGARSGTGKPVLANDPHLPLAAPGPFYLVRLNLPDGPQVGATLPGAPFVVIGHNGHLAWGTTTHQIAAADIVPVAAGAKIETRKETLRARSWGVFWTSKTIMAQSAADGPILDPAYFDLKGFPPGPRLLRTIADDSDNRLAEAVFAMSKAKSVDAFFAATRGWLAPPQTLSVASISGDIGMISPGRFPLRGADGQWRGDIPFSGRLEAKNPKTGWLATANNLMPPVIYPYPTPGGHDSFRVARIAEVLTEDGAHSPAHAKALQGDEFSVLAHHLQPLISAAKPQTASGRAAQTQLINWDSVMRQDSVEATLFAYWLRALGPALYGDELGADLAGEFAGPRNLFLDRALAGDLGHWCDDVTTPKAVETCPEMAGTALDEAANALADARGPDPVNWKWGEAHAAVFPNRLLSALPLIGKRFTVHAPKGGDGTSVNVARNFFGAPGFETTHAAGMRMVADLADLDASLFQNAPGQSGHPGSKHYRDLAPLWSANSGFEIRTDWGADAPPPGASVLGLDPR